MDDSLTADLVIELGDGDRHTIIAMFDGDGSVSWKDFAVTAPTGLRAAVDVHHADPDAAARHWLENRRGLDLSRATFGETGDLPAGDYAVRAYRLPVDLVAQKPAPLGELSTTLVAGGTQA